MILVPSSLDKVECLVFWCMIWESMTMFDGMEEFKFLIIGNNASHIKT